MFLYLVGDENFKVNPSCHNSSYLINEYFQLNLSFPSALKDLRVKQVEFLRFKCGLGVIFLDVGLLLAGL